MAVTAPEPVVADPTPTPTPEPTPTPTPEPVADWRAGLTGDHAALASDKTLANIKGKDWTEAGPTLAKMLVESQKVIGKKTEGMIKVPGAGAKPEEIAAYRAAIGVPPTARDYDVKLPADAPEGITIDPERFAGYATVFHAMNLTNDQVNGIIEWGLREESKKNAKQREEYAQQLDTLAETWGTDVFNRRAGEVQALVRRYADPEFTAWLDQSGMTNHPGLFKMLYPIAREFAESGVIEPVGDSKEGDLTTLDQRINDTRDKYLKSPDGSPQRAAIFEELEKLWKYRAEVIGPA